MTRIKTNINKIFYIFIASHLIIWTLVPSLTNNNLPLDTIEALAWGSNLDWGFNKHPPMSAVFPEFFYRIFGPQDWVYYLLSQIFVITAFYFVYKFSEDFFNNKNYALFSVLLLEGIYFYNFTTPEFNVNVCQLPFWALTVYYVQKCIKKDKVEDYLLLGVFVALGILSKYLFIYLVLGLKIFFIYYVRKHGLKLKYFISGPVLLILLTPHIIWLIENDYITIMYGLGRTGGNGTTLDHIVLPLIFLGKQIGILIPLFAMLFVLTKKIKTKFKFKDEKLLFLLAINIVPIILMFLTSMILGVKIRTMWMTPFYLFFGTFAVYLFQKQINIKNIQKFNLVFLFLFFLSPILYGYISLTENDKRTDYPGRKIAEEVSKIWLLNSAPDIISFINYVGFDEWHAGNLSYNLKSRPKVVFNDDKIFYYPHIVLIYDLHRECPKTVWQLREHKFFINEKQYMICY